MTIYMVNKYSFPTNKSDVSNDYTLEFLTLYSITCFYTSVVHTMNIPQKIHPKGPGEHETLHNRSSSKAIASFTHLSVAIWELFQVLHREFL